MRKFIIITFTLCLIKSTFAISQETKQMHIKIQANEDIVIYRLNNSQASLSLYAQLPLKLEIKNFSTNEKIFYPPQELNTNQTPLANGKNGTLAYYLPWKNVVLFYQNYEKSRDLYELGEVIMGKDSIKKLSGTIEISIFEF